MKKGYHDVDKFYPEDKEVKTETAKSGRNELQVSYAVFIAVWPNQPVKVCAKHAGALIKVGEAIGLKVPLINYLGDENCINCLNEAKYG